MKRIRVCFALSLSLLTWSCLQEESASHFSPKYFPLGTIAINAALQYSSSRAVTVDLTTTGAEMSFFIDQPCSYKAASQWEPVTASKTIQLPDQDGVHTIAVIYRSVDHFASSCQSMQVTLDRVGPFAPTFVTASSRTNTLTKTPLFGFASAIDALSPIVKYQARVVSAGNTPLTAWTDLTATDTTAIQHVITGLSLTDGDHAQIEVHALDAAGNIGTSAFSSLFEAGPFATLAARTFPAASGGFTAALTLPRAASQDIHIYYQTATIDAVSGDDFEPMTSSLTIPAGSTSVNIGLVINDAFPAVTRSFNVNYSEDPGLAGAVSRSYQVAGIQASAATLPAAGFSGISLGATTACTYINATTNAVCWGDQTSVGVSGLFTVPLVYGVHPTGFPANIIKIVTDKESCALLNDDSLWCWGSNPPYDVGDGTTGTPPYLPHLVATDVYDFDIKNGGACFSDYYAEIGCWGNNSFGRFANGTTTNPTGIVYATGYGPSDTPSANPLDIVLGNDFMCVLLDNDRIRCAGSNAVGQLNTGTATPAQRSTLGSTQSTANDFALYAGESSVCAQYYDDSVHCWGSNANGLIGLSPATLLSYTRVTFAALQGAFTISLGTNHACAVDTNFALACWGSNLYGELGRPSVLLNAAYGLATNFNPDAIAVSVRNHQTCAIDDSTRTPSCFGAAKFGASKTNAIGVYDRGDANFGLYPTDNASLGRNVKHLRMGYGVSCAIKDDDHGYCWGINTLANADLTSSFYSVEALDLAGVPVSDIVSGVDHTCYVVKSTGSVWCRGKNDQGQLGDGTVIDRNAFVQVGGLTADTVRLALGQKFSCALSSAGTVKCWGQSDVGQAGTVLTAPVYSVTPLAVSSLTGVIDIKAGLTSMCALASTGSVYCWGGNSVGQVGASPTSASKPVTQVAGISGATLLGVGPNSACALGGDGVSKCWGSNANGQWALGSSSASVTSAAANGFVTGQKGYAIGANSMCVTAGEGFARCAGSNSGGALGAGAIADSMTAVSVRGIETAATEIGATTTYLAATPMSYSCALLIPSGATSGSVKCWGNNGYSTGTRAMGTTHPHALLISN